MVGDIFFIKWFSSPNLNMGLIQQMQVIQFLRYQQHPKEEYSPEVFSGND
jgi:hypothetical protein